MLSFFAMRYHEVKGYWPLMKSKSAPVIVNIPNVSSEKGAADDKAVLT